ncbi:MAG: glycosyltransferase family 4 protein, partial [Chitinophagaceae bacterium]|nr:glycosyltransferase family 4 protein [Chitinophagaceae bacterium]
YKPNDDALDLLMGVINRSLLQLGLKFKIVICGKDIPADLTTRAPANIIIAGFVDDLALYLNGSDLFLNPITEGGGIKTKLVEALAYSLSCVSFESGAVGVPTEITGAKLLTAKDLDTASFAHQVGIALQSKNNTTPEVFFAHFNWSQISKKVVRFLNSDV